MTYHVLITCPHLQRRIEEHRKQLEDLGITFELPTVTQALDEDDLIPIIGRFDGAIVGDDRFTARVFDHARRLKILVKWGIGMDAIDLQAAQARDIRVTNTPAAFTDEVADTVIGYLIMLSRHLHKIDHAVRGGRWEKPEGLALAGKTLGIVGVGAIGRGIARRAAAMNLRLLGYDIHPVPEDFQRDTAIRMVSLDELLESADFITINTSLTPETRHFLDHRAFKRMKTGAYIINTARGPLIDEDELIAALQSGKVAGAALDVFETEPLPAASPLRSMNNVILGSHNSSNTREAVQRVNRITLQKLLEGLEIKS